MARTISGGAVSSVVRDDVGPQPDSDPVAALLMAQLADPTVNAPEKPWGIASLDQAKVGFRFRSKVGLRKPCLTIQVPQDYEDEKKKAHQERMFARKWAGREQEQADLQQLVDEIGGRVVEFTSVPGKFESYLDTDNPRLAAFIRSSQEFAEGRIYEELAPMTVTVNGQAIQVVPANNEARQALAAANAA